MSDWRPIETAPRDGTTIEVMAEDAPPIPMHWNPAGTNHLVQPDAGIWEHASGELTWSEFDGFGPTHWRPMESDGRLVPEMGVAAE